MSVIRGVRFAKIIAIDRLGRRVHSFIDLHNGDILKPASWKAPAKHARGNILDADGGLKLIGPYGPAYLR